MQLSINLPDNIFFGINQTEQSLTQLLKEKLALESYKICSNLFNPRGEDCLYGYL